MSTASARTDGLPETEPRFDAVDDVRARLGEVEYLSDEGIAGIVYLADRLGKPILVEALRAPARPNSPSRWPRSPTAD